MVQGLATITTKPRGFVSKTILFSMNVTDIDLYISEFILKTN